MPDTIRQQIMDALKTRLKTITTTNGYQTDLGKNVFEWRSSALNSGELPAAIYRDTACETEEQISAHQHNLSIEVEVIAASGAGTAVEVRQLIADVAKAVGSDITFGGLATNTIPLGDESASEQDEKKIGGALIHFAVSFRTKEWDHYSQ